MLELGCFASDATSLPRRWKRQLSTRLGCVLQTSALVNKCSMSLRSQVVNSDLIANSQTTTTAKKDVSNDSDDSDSFSDERISTLISEFSVTIAQLKRVIRVSDWPLNHPLRSKLWLDLLKRHNAKVARGTPIIDGGNDEQHIGNKLPVWCDTRYCRFFQLNKAGQELVPRVLWELANERPEITWSPLIYPLAALFLHYYDLDVTLKLLLALIESKNVRFVGVSKVCVARDAFVLVKLTNKFGIIPPRNFHANTRDQLRKEGRVDSEWLQFLQWIFIGLPMAHVVRVVDCFMLEGNKFLFRIALALLLLYRQHCKTNNDQTLSHQQMMSFCESIEKNGITPQGLVTQAVKLTRISRSKINRAYSKADSSLSSNEETHCHLNNAEKDSETSKTSHRQDMIRESDYIFRARIAPRRFKSTIVDWSLLDLLWQWLPERVVISEPTVVFCTAEHGNSLKTFYSHCGDHEPTILLVRSTVGEVKRIKFIILIKINSNSVKIYKIKLI